MLRQLKKRRQSCAVVGGRGRSRKAKKSKPWPEDISVPPELPGRGSDETSYEAFAFASSSLEEKKKKKQKQKKGRATQLRGRSTSKSNNVYLMSRSLNIKTPAGF